MKLSLKFAVIRAALHAPPESPRDLSASLKLVPLAPHGISHDENSALNTHTLWPRGVDGVIELNFLNAEIVKTVKAGSVVGITVEIED